MRIDSEFPHYDMSLSKDSWQGENLQARPPNFDIFCSILRPNRIKLIYDINLLMIGEVCKQSLVLLQPVAKLSKRINRIVKQVKHFQVPTFSAQQLAQAGHTHAGVPEAQRLEGQLACI